MKQAWRRSLPSWRVTDARTFRPGLALAAIAVVGVLLLEVWQCSAVASLSVRAGRANDELRRASAELAWNRAAVDRGSSRSEVGSLATSLGVRPADANQVVWLPAEYLQEDEALAASVPPTLLAAAGRVLQSIVPEATARGRRVN